MDPETIRGHLRRTPWRDFPDVVIHAEEPVVKKHSHYPAAKGGHEKAAEELVIETIAAEAVGRIGSILAGRRPLLLAVHALETEGGNAIPRVFARVLSRTLDLSVERGVIQSNQVKHTGAGGFYRLASPALFEGVVQQGAEYFLVDDFIGQGGTLANLRGLIESQGALVVGATALTGKSYSAKLRLEDQTLRTLREKHGKELETWWITTFGYGFERLTESEARYLTRADDAHTISERITAAV